MIFSLLFFCLNQKFIYFCIENNFVMNANSVQTAKNKLEESGVSPSLQRMAILQYLLEHRTHPTVDEIYSALVEQIPTLSRTTVHNTLKMFSELGLALSLTIEDKQMRYDGDTHPHAHFRCQQCGKIMDVEMSSLPVFVNHDIQIKDMQVLIKGFCGDCR